MQNLHQREEKIQNKRKSTSWRDFLMEVGPRQSLVFYKQDNKICRYPKNNRIGELVSAQEFVENANDKNMTNNIYNFDLSLFENIHNTRKQVTFPRLRQGWGAENAEYADVAFNVKNAYLTNVVYFDAENTLYSFDVGGTTKNVFNSVHVTNHSENIYQSTSIIQSFNIFYAKYIINSNNIRFSSDLIGCNECICCNNLENQSYCINNQKLDKEEYFMKKKEILAKKETYKNLYSQLKGTGINRGSKNCSGKFIINSEDVENGYIIGNIKNGRNNILVGEGHGTLENSFDNMLSGNEANNVYGCHGVSPGNNFYITINSTGSNIYYCYFMLNCSYCLGCVGLQNKSFCILNKQYTKEERFELANKIFAQMDAEGTLGQFFPGSMNPFYFNDTAAYLIDDTFTKEEVTAAGYLRRDDEIKVDVPTNADIVGTKYLSSYQGFDEKGNRHINPDILKKVIKDEKGNIYRIVPMELDFLQKHGLPLPEIHWLDRIKLGFTFK